MKIPRHWVREQRELCGVQCRLRGWSDDSMDAARQMLEERARLLQEFYAEPVTDERARRLRADLASLATAGQGEYAADMLEPVVRGLDAANIITRNRYGSLVLNSTDTCFADVDTVPQTLLQLLKSLFGAGAAPEQRLLATLRQVGAEHPELSMRLYRTAKGWRILFSGPGIELGSPLVDTLFTRLHVDPLYSALCRKQACWRARLTPKPWRLKLPRCPQPASSEEAATLQEDWVQQYNRACSGHAVCRLVESLGPRVQEGIVELHDQLTGVSLNADTLV